MDEPLTIAKIRAMPTPQDVIAAVKRYDQQLRDKQAEAHQLRDDAIRDLLIGRSIAAVARISGMSVSHVRLVKMIVRQK